MPRSPRCRQALGAVVVTATFAMAATGTSAAVGGPSSPTTTPSTTTTTAQSVELARADNASVAAAQHRLRSTEAALGAAQRGLRAAQGAAAAAAAAERRNGVLVQSLAAEEQAAIRSIESTRTQLRILAVSSYVSGGPIGPLNALLAARSVEEFARRRELVSSVARADNRALRAYDGARRRASKAALAALAEGDRDRAAHAVADAAVSAAVADLSQRTRQHADASQLLQLVTAASPYPGTDIPRLVLDAYQRAASSVQARACKLPWAALAGIGKVESDHGRSQKAALTLGGLLTPPIIGPALDGQNGTALITDTDNGKWDGDPTYAHAIGPMQMIESTWASVAGDGNSDGTADPNDIYDASLAAAVYLCRAVGGAGLDTDAGLQAAFFSYNHADWYAAEVLGLTHVYAGVALAS